jgi:predicted transcriptional regulator
MAYLTIAGQGSAEIVVSRSRFLCTLERVEDEISARGVIEQARREHWDARHHCSAFVLGPDRAVERSNDDGEPPVMAAEVAGSVSERALLDALFAGEAKLADQVDTHMSPPLPESGASEGVQEAIAALERADALLVQEDGRPVGVLTRADLLNFLAAFR